MFDVVVVVGGISGKLKNRQNSLILKYSNAPIANLWT